MFIPLTINQRREGLPNVLIAGDTAGIFYVLSHLTALELNVFLADTGIRRPLREFPCHRAESKDRANVYYDFFDGRIGAGIVRRMDVALTTSCDLKRWTRGFRIPAVHLWQDASGTWLEFEGADTILEKGSASIGIGGLLSRFVTLARTLRYVQSSSRALLDKAGDLHAFPAAEKWECKKLALEESTFSAWDRAGDLLKKSERLLLSDDDVVGPGEDRRLIELCVPELDVVDIESGDKTRHVELTGDLARVFDGLF
jgi:hypothetical protein